MADRALAPIAIGGSLPRSSLEELAQIIDDEGLDLDQEVTGFSVDAIPAEWPVEPEVNEVA